MKARRPCRGLAGLMPKPQASTGLHALLCAVLEGSRIAQRAMLYLHHDKSRVALRLGVLCITIIFDRRLGPVCMVTQYLVPVSLRRLLPPFYKLLFPCDLTLKLFFQGQYQWSTSCGNFKIYAGPTCSQIYYYSSPKNLTIMSWLFDCPSTSLPRLGKWS